MSNDAPSLDDQIRRGISWNAIGAVATNLMRVAVITILGRMLSSKDFGIVAAATSVNTVLYAVRDAGVGLALVQRRSLDREHLATAFAVSVYLGLLLSFVLLVTGQLLGDVMGVPESGNVVRVVGLLFILRGVSTTSRMTAQRSMKFRRIALIDAATFVVGSVASIALSFTGFGPWSIVVGYLIEDALATTWYVVAFPPVVTLRPKWIYLRDLMTFGTGQTIGQIAGVFAINGDNFVVGRVLGARMLGFYARAYDLIKFPTTVFATIIGNVLFPAFAKLQDDKPRLRVSFRRLTMVNGLILMPSSALLVVLAPEVIRVLMGPKWDSAILPFQILAASILSRNNQKFGSLVANATNAVNGVAVALTILMVCVIGGALLSIQWGIPGVAASTAIAITISNVTCTYLAMQTTTLDVRGVAAAHVPGLVLTVVAIGVSWPAAAVLRAHTNYSIVILLAVGGIAALVSVAVGAALVLRAREDSDLGWLRSEIRRLRSRRAKPKPTGPTLVSDGT